MNSKKKTQYFLKDEQFGSPISEKLSKYLRAYTGKNERADVSRKTGVGSSTIRDVTFRNNNLTEDNSKAIVCLVEIAIEKCSSSIKTAAETAKSLKSILKKS